MKSFLWLLAAAFIIVWGIGVLGVGILVALGSMIHILLVIGIVIIVYNLVTGRTSE